MGVAVRVRMRVAVGVAVRVLVRVAVARLLAWERRWRMVVAWMDRLSLSRAARACMTTPESRILASMSWWTRRPWDPRRIICGGDRRGDAWEEGRNATRERVSDVGVGAETSLLAHPWYTKNTAIVVVIISAHMQAHEPCRGNTNDHPPG